MATDMDEYMNTKNNEQDKYKAALLIELARYIQLQCREWDMNDEFDLAVYSVWYLLNPMNLPDRSKIDIEYARYETDECGPYRRRCRFTSHPHHNEPLIPSAEDMVIYGSFPGNNKYNSHFITDRFNLCKVDTERKNWSFCGLHNFSDNGII